jgi:hypothetical protein
MQDKTLLSLNIPAFDALFPGFTPGDFAVLHGSSSVISLTSLLCVRAQLPPQIGGLGSKVVFVDGGITFRLYKIARLAQLYQLDPQTVLEGILLSRAFTAYQLTFLLLEKLTHAIDAYDAKIAIVSDIARAFLDSNIPAEEAQRIYSQILTYLSELADKKQIILIATYLPYQNSKRNSLLHQSTLQAANTVLCFSKTQHTRTVSLQKHPYYTLGSADLSPKISTLTDFIGVDVG